MLEFCWNLLTLLNGQGIWADIEQLMAPVLELFPVDLRDN